MCYNHSMSNSKDNSEASVRKRGIKELLSGAGIAIVGGVATYLSYSTARPGGSYTVYTGIIAIGVIYAFKGLYDIAFPAGLGKKKNTSDNPITTAEKAEAAVEAETVKEED